MVAPTVSSSVLDQYTLALREETDQEKAKLESEASKITDRLHGVGKKVFDKHAKAMIEGFKTENLEKLKPTLKKEIENQLKIEDKESHRKAKVIATVALLVVGGVAAAIIASQALVVAASIAAFVVVIFQFIGALLSGALFLGVGAATATPAFVATALALTFSIKGAVIAAISAVVTGLGLGIGIPAAQKLKLNEDRVEKRLTEQVTAYNKEIFTAVKAALNQEANWEDQFNALIAKGLFTQDNLKIFKEFLEKQPA